MSSTNKTKSLKLSSTDSLRKSFSKGFKKFNSMLTPRTEKANQEKQPQSTKDAVKPKEEAKPAEQVEEKKETPMFEGVVSEEAAQSPEAPKSPEVHEEDAVKPAEVVVATDEGEEVEAEKEEGVPESGVSPVIETAPSVEEVPEGVDALPLVSTPVAGPADVEEEVCTKRGLGLIGALSITGAVAVGVVLGVKGPLRRKHTS